MTLLPLELLASALLVVTLGYALILSLAPGVFRPREVEAAVAVLLGLCAAGAAPILPARLAPDSQWFERAIVWTVPCLLGLSAAAALARNRNIALPTFVRLRRSRLPSTSLLPAVVPTISVAFLLLGSSFVFAARPVPSPSLELYGSPTKNGFRITVVSYAKAPQHFVLVARSKPVKPAFVSRIPPVSKQTGPVTLRIRARGTVTFALYRRGEHITSGRPLRWIQMTRSLRS